ncbi:unnamed protein product (macronuclear) [Paramecium tetraurelia]|uniref:Uncharacterized protein n=1 Tax=Paramecium tetraurelia TaxID=5888 RepID=A0EFZ3_PARTE|nr:uncharacterized protein GSPATT00026557001 [Paramecium tetraurelia]CAK94234.1 unnamed protein product [Paramecium tetraurelia]|eukprot:XP_001461607.1 hypothetical protein (macronuclear) [Paramecium tetraurelia strain d4-2]
MKNSLRLLNCFEKDLNQLETPPIQSRLINYEILIKTKNYLDNVFYQKLEKSSIHTQSILAASKTNNKSLVLEEERNQRSRTIDHLPQELKIDSQLRSIPEKQIKIKECTQTKLNSGETQSSQTTLRKETSSFVMKGILKNQSSHVELNKRQKRSVSVHSGKSVRFNLPNDNLIQLMMFAK